MIRSFACWLVVLLATGCSRTEQVEAAEDRPDGVATHYLGTEAPQVGQWPVWRGPWLDLVSREENWDSAWPEAGPPQLWKTNVGTGFSSVSVADGRLYTMGHTDGKDSVYCLDAETGEPIWTHTYEAPLVDNLHEGGPATTPTVHDGVVYTISKDGKVFCLGAADGKVQWSVELQELLDVAMPDWGFSCSPIVLGERLIIEAGKTCALDRKTGELLWETAKYRPGYGSPTPFLHQDELLVSVVNNDAMLVVRVSDGKEVARTKWESSFATAATTPIVVDDTIFLSSGYNQGSALYQLQGDQLTELYKNKSMRNQMNPSVLWGRYLYGIDGNSHIRRNGLLVCMDYQTGKVAWEQRGFGVGSVMVADGKLIILSDEGELVIAEATPEAFREISRAKVLDGKCWTLPVLASGRIYCRNAAGDLLAVDVRGRVSE